MVSPGSIRNAENTLLAELDRHISDYNALKAYVAQTPSQNLYPPGALTEPTLKSNQDNLLLAIGDGIELVGRLTGAFNMAAKNYAHGDAGSFMPES